MKKALITFYSRSGYTRRIAHEIAARCIADMEDIQLADERIGWRGYLRSLHEAITGGLPRLGPLEHAPGDYPLVLIGTPVWAYRVSGPMRAYLTRARGKLPHVAFFCTLGGAGAERVLAELTRLAGRDPVATLVLTDAEIDRNQYAAKLGQFVDRAVSQPLAARAPATVAAS